MNIFRVWKDRAHKSVFVGYQAIVKLQGNVAHLAKKPSHHDITRSRMSTIEILSHWSTPRICSNKVACVYIWRRTVSRETNTRTTTEISIPYNSYHTSYHRNQTVHCSHAFWVYSVRGKPWWIPHRWLIEDTFGEDSICFYSEIRERCCILLFDINGQTCNATLRLN